MSPEEKSLIKVSWRAVESIVNEAAVLFYDRLFELDPELRSLFRHTDMAATVFGTVTTTPSGSRCSGPWSKVSVRAGLRSWSRPGPEPTL